MVFAFVLIHLSSVRTKSEQLLINDASPFRNNCKFHLLIFHHFQGCSLPYHLSLFRLSAMWKIWDSVKRRATGIFGTRRTTDPSEGKSVAMRTGYVFIEIIRNVNRSTGLN